MTCFEAQSIYMDLIVHNQYKDLFGKSRTDVVLEYVRKYGIEKIREAVKVLLEDLNHERIKYLRFLNVAETAKLMEDKHGQTS